MSDPSFHRAIQVIEDAKRLPFSDATRAMFDHFNTASQPVREAFVLALIGDVLASHARRSANPARAAFPTLSEPEQAA